MKKYCRFFLCILILRALTLSAAGADYLEFLPAGQPIYAGAGYDHTRCGTVAEDGVYTIVEEDVDDGGNLWGRLKSGAGWIDLTFFREQDCCLTVERADQAFLDTGTYTQFIAEESEYLEKLVIRTSETLVNVSLMEFGVTDAGLSAERALHFMTLLEPEQPLVAGVVFYGDMTAYGLIAGDGDGKPRCFIISISGYDGSPVVSEYNIVAVP